MFKFKRRKKDPLIKIIEVMQAEQEMMISSLCMQVEAMLNALPPEEQLKMIAILKGEPIQ